MMRKSAALLLVALCLTILLTACSPADSRSSGERARFSGRSIDILMDMGGCGNYYEPVIMKLQELYPGLIVNFSYQVGGDQIFGVKALSGSIPDIFNLNQGKFDYYSVIDQGHCLPLDKILESPASDGRALKDLMDPLQLEYGKYQSHYFLMPETVFAAGMWYDAKLLRENGLIAPRTWDEYLKVCEKLKGNGVYAIGYCGEDAANEYAVCYWFLPMLASTDSELLGRVERLDPTVWDEPGMRETLEKMVQIRDRGYFDPETLQMNNAEVQSKFINREFLFLPCGSWLENEMADSWPEDFELTFLPFSGKNRSDGTDYVMTMPLVSAVSSETQNQDIVQEFYRLLLSDVATVQKQVEVHGNSMALEAFLPQYGESMKSSVLQLWESTEAQDCTYFTPRSYTLYPDFATLAGQTITELMRSQLTVDQFCQRMRSQFETLRSRNGTMRARMAGLVPWPSELERGNA